MNTKSDKLPGFSGPALCAESARTVVDMLKKKEITPGDLLDASYARISQVEDAINAIPTLCEDRARESVSILIDHEKENRDHAGWLAGLPIGIKDLTAVSGVKTTFGTMALKDNVSPDNDPLVDVLESRGAVIVGKTNTPEMGAGGNTFNEVFGYTRNPWDIRKNAGGSSGGAAASLASGEVWLSQGSDLAGSLRTPAAYCGVVGFRPSPGRVGGGPPPAAFLMEGISGPMARDVEDIALFMDAMCGYDQRVPLSIEAPVTPFQESVARADEKIRIGFSPDQNGFAPVEKEIQQILEKSMAQVEGNGGTVELACPELPDLYETSITLRGIHYGSVVARLPDPVQQHFKQTLKENVQTGLDLTADQIFTAIRNRTSLYHQVREFLLNFDVLAIPVVGLEPGMVEEEYPPLVDGLVVSDYVDWLRFSFLATTIGFPAISISVGFTRSGMPVGIQLVGPPRGEEKLLQVARAVEVAVGFPSRPIDPVVVL